MPVLDPPRPETSRAPAPRLWLGVDGGGTHTRLRLQDAHGRLLGEGRAGPSALGQGVEQAWKNIGLALQQAATEAGLGSRIDWSHCALGLGLSGAETPGLAPAFRASDPGCAALALDSDAYTGLLGAHGGRPGVLLIAGTGSIAMALRADGSRQSVGGWGWRNGDEGSGAWLGKAVMRHAQRALDGRDVPGALAEALWKRIGRSAAELLAWETQASQTQYASLAPLVFEQGQDPVAQQLQHEAVQDLEAMLHAVDPSGTLPLALSGSVGQRLALQFSPSIRARFVTPQGDAMDGALRLVRSSLSSRSA